MATKGNAEQFTLLLSTATLSPVVTSIEVPRNLNVLGIALSASGNATGFVYCSLNPTALQTTGILALMATSGADLGTKGGGGVGLFIPIKTFLMSGRLIYLYDSGVNDVAAALLICEAA